ncbi:hypothetical protein [Streptomyces griseorubiginosus]|uniref:hypothetical protein n=1 Tax=Streptomyces griseorubiginosus TaxID=67304 RepID=UPI00331D5E65
MLAYTAGEARIRELDEGLKRSPQTLMRKYDAAIAALPLARYGRKDRNKGPNKAGYHYPVVYFARRERLIKIGWTSRLPDRMKAVGAVSLATETGDYIRERQLHQKFAHLLVEGHGAVGREWFHPGPDLIAYINELRAASGIPPVDGPAPTIGKSVELKAYLSGTTWYHAGQALTQDGELLSGRMRKVKGSLSNVRPLVHAAVTGTVPTGRTAVAACARSKEIGPGSGGLVAASTMPSRDRCTRPACRAYWATLPE